MHAVIVTGNGPLLLAVILIYALAFAYVAWKLW